MLKHCHTKDLLYKERASRKKMKLKLDGAIHERIVSLCFVVFAEIGAVDVADAVTELCSHNLLNLLSCSHRIQMTGQSWRSVSFVWYRFNW